jgi:uncharacterized protein (TIGR03435 family)
MATCIAWGWRWIRLRGFACRNVELPLRSGEAPSKSGPARKFFSTLQHDYRFEVASIRPVGPPTGSEYPSGVIPPSYTPGRYRELKISLGSLTWKAFGVKYRYQIECPEWMYSSYFTVNATLPEGTTKADLPIMILHLLEDRFDLKVHHETRQMDGFQLVVAKSGPKLTKSVEPLPDSSVPKGAFTFPAMKDGVPQFTKDSGPAQLYTASPAGLVAWWHGRDESMQRLASDIASRLKVPVSDATGLEGKYDFSLNFIEESPSTPAGSNGASAPSDYSPLPNALEQQLGLKLRPVKNVPVDVVVLDSAKREPTDN